MSRTRASELLAGYARAVEAGGADLLLIGANTMHKVAPAVQEAIRISLLLGAADSPVPVFDTLALHAAAAVDAALA